MSDRRIHRERRVADADRRANGRPRLVIDVVEVERRVDLGEALGEILQELHCSPRTFRRRIHDRRAALALELALAAGYDPHALPLRRCSHFGCYAYVLNGICSRGHLL